MILWTLKLSRNAANVCKQSTLPTVGDSMLPMCGMEYFESVRKVGCVLSLQLGKAPKKTPVNEGILLRRCRYPHSPQRGGCIGQ